MQLCPKLTSTACKVKYTLNFGKRYHCVLNFKLVPLDIGTDINLYFRQNIYKIQWLPMESHL